MHRVILGAKQASMLTGLPLCTILFHYAVIIFAGWLQARNSRICCHSCAHALHLCPSLWHQKIFYFTRPARFGAEDTTSFLNERPSAAAQAAERSQYGAGAVAFSFAQVGKDTEAQVGQLFKLEKGLGCCDTVHSCIASFVGRWWWLAMCPAGIPG